MRDEKIVARQSVLELDLEPRQLGGRVAEKRPHRRNCGAMGGGGDRAGAAVRARSAVAQLCEPSTLPAEERLPIPRR